MKFRIRHRVVFFFTASLILCAFPAVPAEQQTAPAAEIAKKSIERQKAFLLRSSDELNRTLIFVNETVALLIEQVEAAAGREPEGRDDERLALLDWYQRYEEWLRAMSAEMELEVGNYFARQKPGTDWTARYAELTKGNQRFAGELGRAVKILDGETERIEARVQKVRTAVAEQRVLVDKDDLELARKLWPKQDVSYERGTPVYKKLTDEEVLRLRAELRLLDERQKYFDLLAELGKYEQVWLDMKAEDFARLNDIAAVIAGDDRGALQFALRSAIRTYEADVNTLKRRIAELNAKNRMARTGTLRTLDLLEEQSRYYENMKGRFGRQLDWLAGQIGSCQADLVETAKDL